MGKVRGKKTASCLLSVSRSASCRKNRSDLKMGKKRKESRVEKEEKLSDNPLLGDLSGQLCLKIAKSEKRDYYEFCVYRRKGPK